MKTRFTIYKAFCGSGVLLLPSAAHNGGYLFYVIIQAIFVFLVIKSTLLLLECAVEVRGSYGDIAR